jgi:hypothetical protein
VKSNKITAMTEYNVLNDLNGSNNLNNLNELDDSNDSNGSNNLNNLNNLNELDDSNDSNDSNDSLLDYVCIKFSNSCVIFYLLGQSCNNLLKNVPIDSDNMTIMASYSSTLAILNLAEYILVAKQCRKKYLLSNEITQLNLSIPIIKNKVNLTTAGLILPTAINYLINYGLKKKINTNFTTKKFYTDTFLTATVIIGSTFILKFINKLSKRYKSNNKKIFFKV